MVLQGAARVEAEHSPGWLTCAEATLNQERPSGACPLVHPRGALRQSSVQSAHQVHPRSTHREEEDTVYIGIGTVVLILVVIAIVMMMRRSRV